MPPIAADLLARFVPQSFHSAEGGTLPYRFLKPEGTVGPLPLVVLLHGAGERGDDNQAQLGNGAGEWLGGDRARAAFPCYFVLPQCPTNQRWVEVDWSAASHQMPETPSRPMSLLQGLIDELSTDPNIDRRRLYLVGLSMGGYGTWDLLCRWPTRFAAAVPICGGADPAHAGALRDLPIWAFHGAQDSVVTVERSRQMVQALRAEGGQPRYTELLDVGHDAWNVAFSHPDVRQWLFSQRRG